MQPVQITVRDSANSVALEGHIRKKAEKLTQLCQRINSCRIVITIPQKHKHHGKLYCVRIDLTVPGKEIVANHRKNQDIYVAIRDAFHAAERQLENYERKRRGYVKAHDGITRGYITKIFAEEGYGFIQGMDGNEFYFSLTNVAYPKFDKLELGDIVEFLSEPSSEGLQAHRVTKEKEHEWIFDEF